MLIDKLVSKLQIEKGWSGDTKYSATDNNQNKYLLRISPKEAFNTKQKEFFYANETAKLNVPICEPLEFGECDEGVYIIYSWVEGIDAEGYIKTLPEDKQYDYGIKAGNYLKRIHSVLPNEPKDWNEFFRRKANHKIKIYNDCPIKYDNGEKFIECIKNNIHLVKKRSVTFQHGDYHIGNMMIGNDGELYIIDFNRYDIGDPWEEFNRIVWSVSESEIFATGIIDGYFEGEPPMEFWRLLALYISSNTLGSLPWCLNYEEEQTTIMKNQAADVLSWYDNMTKLVPNWYKRRK